MPQLKYKDPVDGVWKPLVIGAGGPQGPQGDGIIPGEGMPNGRVVASPGAIYKDIVVSGTGAKQVLGTNGAMLWIKESGVNSNTGWVILQGDTKWRKIPLHSSMNPSYGFIYMRRINNEVYFTVSDIWPTVSGELMILPGGDPMAIGFRITGRVASSVFREGTIIANSVLGWKSAGLFYQSAGANSWTYAQVSGLTTEAWPSQTLSEIP